ncbi:uncharacterized protein N7459_002548 [Penicillium hispanicum]|uniref:uncharacterized protein n=1 Tax=Penicillium hispanicum TaxID=1080232 RepID=UPI002541FA9E|nr:uncharacterized protein N7459_002548 [Penicillium hispanicum]KAJ5586783.1 hypothetical protein N7459_002548 [Penicillium hispanicum]
MTVFSVADQIPPKHTSHANTINAAVALENHQDAGSELVRWSWVLELNVRDAGRSLAAERGPMTSVVGQPCEALGASAVDRWPHSKAFWKLNGALV